MKVPLKRKVGNLTLAKIDSGTQPSPTGVYVHFPYCLKKCPYCDFASYATPRDDVPHARYADAVLAELTARTPEIGEHRRLSTIFFGGGTPSLWAPTELGRVIRGIRDAFALIDDDLEITVECNPTSLDESRAAALLAQGVNRLSIGVQSLDRERLAFLGRLHGADDGLRALREARRAGFERVSGDLIFAVAGGRAQAPADAAREATALAAEGLRHVSAYGLTIEPGTQFGQLHRKGRLPVACDDTVVESFFAVEEALERAGLTHYEISNYAEPGQEARHNLGYWNGHDYLGLGTAAVGTMSSAAGPARRQKNHADPARYMKLALEQSSCAVETELLDPETRLRERIMLGLRLERGIDLGAAGRALAIDPFTEERSKAIRELGARGQLLVDGEAIRVPRSARALTDGIAAALF